MPQTRTCERASAPAVSANGVPVWRSLVLAVALLIVGISGPAWSEPAPASSLSTDKVITLVADYWSPYNALPDSDKPGYGVEVARHIFNQAGYQVDYSLMPWTRAINETRKGAYHAIIGAYREDAADFVFPEEPIGLSQNVFYVRNESDWRYQGLTSLDDRKIVLIHSYSYGAELDAYFREHAQQVQFVYGDHALENAIKMLLSGRVDVLVEDANVFGEKLSQLGYGNLIKAADHASEQEPVYIAFSPALDNAEQLAALLSAGLRRLHGTGELDAILARYGLKSWKAQ